MIDSIRHITTKDRYEFDDRLGAAVREIQDEEGHEVEIQYSTDALGHAIVYSALVIGRKRG